MGAALKNFVQQEVDCLTHLKEVLEAERECLRRMDREGLLEHAREKELAVRRLQALNLEKQRLGIGAEALRRDPALAGLNQRRKDLIHSVHEQNLVQSEILDGQMERVGLLLAFIRNVNSQSSIYNSRGKLR